MPTFLTVGFVALLLAQASFGQTNVLTYRNDSMRTGQNVSETVLTPANVQFETFGLRFSYPVDGLVDAQPLVVSGLTIANGTHNVVFAATENDSVYAFDANTGATYWKVSVVGAGETPSDPHNCTNVIPTIGITSTPVIDLQSGPHGTIYVVGMTKDASGGYHHRLHALDITTGAEEFGGPTEIQATYPGTGANSSNGSVVFNPAQYKERSALTLANGVIYTAFASHCDNGIYGSWTMGYNETTLAQTSVLSFTPNGSDGGIWGSGGGVSADSNGTLFYALGNGTFDTTVNSSGFPALGDYGNSFVKVAPIGGVLTPLDYWTMNNTIIESTDDRDLGSGGLVLLPDLVDSMGNIHHLGAGGGKDHDVYVFDRDNMGKFDSANNGTLYQELAGAIVGGLWSSPAWFNGNLYFGGHVDVIRSFKLNPETLMFGATPTSTTAAANRYPYPGASPSISANGTANAILWAVENTSPAVLHAYDATNLATELYNSSQAPSGRDQFANNKYITPTIADGEVFVGTPNSVAVFGLLPAPAASFAPSSVSFPNQALNTTGTAQSITLTNGGPNGLLIGSIAVTGLNPGDFAQTNNCPLSPTAIAPNVSCTITITFTPLALNARSAAVTITDNATNSPQSVPLSGTGTSTPPTVTLSPSPVSFPNQTVYTTSAAQAIKLTNNGPGAVALGSITITGTNPGDFAQTSNCPVSPATLAGNTFCTINVTFTPLAANLRSAAITITDNGAASPQSVSVSGTGTAVVAGPTWPNGYSYQATFTVAAGQVPSAQTNFPTLISGTWADFATTANGGRIINTCTQTVGNNATPVPCDLIFTSDAAGTQLLSWEFANWTPTTGAVNIWVNAPNLANGTVIYAWYGQPSVTTLQTTPSSTWSSSFQAVYHMKENPAGPAPQLNDSTVNGNSATMNGTVLANQQQPGEIGGSINFEGDTWASLANPANFSFERTNPFSLSGWFKIASNSPGTLLSKFVGGNAGWALIQEPGATSPVFALGLFSSGESTMALAQTPGVSTGAWHYVVATYAGTSTVAGMNIYVDGVNQPLTTINNTLAGSILNTSTPAINGRGGPSQMSTDTIEEIRVSTPGVVFSPAYVTASYNNQSQPGTFFTAVTGLTTSGSLSPSPSSVSFTNQNVNTTSAAQGVTLTNNGSGAVTIGGIAITGTNPGDFAQTNNCPATLAVSSFCTVSVTFTPLAANARGVNVTLTVQKLLTASVTFTPLAANARSAAMTVSGSSPVSVGLSGTGILVPSAVTLAPTSLTFTTQTVNTTSGAQGITVTNSGPSPLTISSIAVTGTNPGDFAQTNNCPISPATLAVNAFCTINVTFTPLAANLRSAAITLTDNGAASPQSVGVSGTGTAVVAGPTWPNGYNYQATFTVAAGKVPSAQTNFPTLISGTWADFATTANGGRIINTCTQTVGNNATPVPCDLIFTSDAAGTQLLSWEFDSWTSTTGAVNIWVNAPNLANGTVIYAWYGQPSVTALQTTPSSTWSSSFQAVYHMKENPAGAAPQLNDSTASGNSATMNGTVLTSQQQPGEIGGSINFEGNTWASLANPANFSFERTNPFSLSGWFKIASNSAGTLLSKFVGGNAGWALIQEPGTTNPVFALGLFSSGESTMALAQTPGVSTGAWHYVVATYAGTSTVAGMNIYVDGVNQPLTTINNTLAGSILNTSTPAINGRGGPSQMSTDTIDEIRVSTPGVVFSPAYVTASYNNQSQPGAFFTAVTGLTTSGSLSPSPSSVSFTNQNVNTTSAAQSVTLTNNGSGAVTIGGIAITGTNPGDFAQTNNCPATLAVSSFCTVSVTFTPLAANARSAAMTVSGSSPVSVGLSGTGILVPSTVTLAPTSLTFANQTVNTMSTAQGITVTNSGPSPLTISSIAVTGTNPGDFAQTSNCPVSPATIAVNAFCTINVTFTPLSANLRSAAITITDNGAASPQSVGVSGTGTAVVAGPAWPNGYNYQATFTVAAGKVPSAQTNFPTLISGTWADFATTANGGRIINTCTQTVGNNATPVPCDLIFTSDAAGTQLLSWEFDSWTPTTGAVNIWVNAPNLANGTVIYAWYGQPSVTTLQTTPSSTWSSSFQAVYHMKENPAGAAPQLNDSTANGNSATMNGTVLANQQQPGEIGGSINFEGNTWASLANPANFSFERTDSFSLSGWFKIASNSTGTLLSKFPANEIAGWALLQETGAAKPAFALGLVGSGGVALASTPLVTTGVWHYVVATYSGTSTVAGMQIYVDGVNQTLNTLSNNLSASIVNTTTPEINGRGGANQMSTDTVDEIRISTKGVVFTPAFVTASYNNQSQPGAFFTVVTGLIN